MKRIRDFKAPIDARSADELRRQLVQFETNTSDALDFLGLTSMRRLQVKVRITSSNGQTVAPGQSLGITATVTRVQLAPPTPGDAGKFLAICKGAGAIGNTTVYAPGGSLVNGAASYVITANGILKLFYCDGIDYWVEQ